MKASVIIPAYNAALFLKQAIWSVLQDPPSFPYEILVIDDGSTDETPRLLEEWQKTVPELVWIRRENAGPAAARNLGIEMAKGEYLLFLDSDDAFVPGALEKAVTLAEREQAQLLIFGYYVVQNGEKSRYCHPSCRLEKNEDWKKHLAHLYRGNMINQVWGKVFSAKLLKEENILFPSQLWGEDRLFLFQVLEKANTVAIAEECLYDYIQQQNSLISRFVPNKGEVCGEIHRAITDLALSKGPLTEEEKEVFSYMYAKSLLSVSATLYSPSCPFSYGEKRKFLKDLLSRAPLETLLPPPKEAGRSFGILFRILKSKNVTLNLFAAWGMKTASRLLPSVFRKSKHAYNK